MRLMVAGRLLNTVKYIKMACSSNFGNVFSVLGRFYGLLEGLTITFRISSCLCLASLPANVTVATADSKLALRLLSGINSLVRVLFSSLLVEILFVAGTTLIQSISNVQGYGVLGPSFGS